MSVDVQQYEFKWSDYVLISIAVGEKPPAKWANDRVRKFKENSELCKKLKSEGIIFDVVPALVKSFHNGSSIQIDQHDDNVGEEELGKQDLEYFRKNLYKGLRVPENLDDLGLPEEFIKSIKTCEQLDVSDIARALERNLYVTRVEEPEVEVVTQWKPSVKYDSIQFGSADDMVNSMHYLSPYIFSLEELEEESEVYKKHVDELKQITKKSDQVMKDFFKLSDEERLSLEQKAFTWSKKKWCDLADVVIPLTEEEKFEAMKGELDQELLEAYISMQQTFNSRIDELEERVQKKK